MQTAKHMRGRMLSCLDLSEHDVIESKIGLMWVLVVRCNKRHHMVSVPSGFLADSVDKLEVPQPETMEARAFKDASSLPTFKRFSKCNFANVLTIYIPRHCRGRLAGTNCPLNTQKAIEASYLVVPLTASSCDLLSVRVADQRRWVQRPVLQEPVRHGQYDMA